MILFDDVIGSNVSDKKLAYANQIWSTKNNKFVEDILNDCFVGADLSLVSYGDDYGLTYSLKTVSGGSKQGPVLHPVGSIQNEPGLMRYSDKTKLDELYTYKPKIDELYTYGHVAVIPSWKALSSLTEKSTSDEIINILKLRDLAGNTITDASKINNIFDICAVNGKYLIENNTRAKIQVEYIGNCFVLTKIGNAIYLDENKNIKYRPSVYVIALQYNNGLKVIHPYKEYTLYQCNNLNTYNTSELFDCTNVSHNINAQRIKVPVNKLSLYVKYITSITFKLKNDVISDLGDIKLFIKNENDTELGRSINVVNQYNNRNKYITFYFDPIVLQNTNSLIIEAHSTTNQDTIIPLNLHINNNKSELGIQVEDKQSAYQANYCPALGFNVTNVVQADLCNKLEQYNKLISLKS